MTKTRSDVPVFLLYAGIIHAIALALLLPMIVTLPGPSVETAPAPVRASAPEISPVDVVVLPPPQPLTDIGPEVTSALPSAPRPSEENAPAAAPVVNEAEPEQETKAQETKDTPAIEPQEQVTPPRTAPAETKTLTPETPVNGGVEAASSPNGTVARPAVGSEPDQAPQKTEPLKEGAAAQDAVPAKASTSADKATPAKATPRTAKKPIAQRSRTTKPSPSRTAGRSAKSQSQFAPFNGMLSGLLSPPANKRR